MLWKAVCSSGLVTGWNARNSRGLTTTSPLTCCVWPWANYLTSVHTGFFICLKGRRIKIPTWAVWSLWFCTDICIQSTVQELNSINNVWLWKPISQDSHSNYICTLVMSTHLPSLIFIYALDKIVFQGKTGKRKWGRCFSQMMLDSIEMLDSSEIKETNLL